jgi:hypothetical protein
VFYHDDRIKTHNSSNNNLDTIILLNEESEEKNLEESLETEVKNFVEKKK